MADERQQALLAAFGRLDERQQEMLLEFAAFMAARNAAAAPVMAPPQPEPRPAEESVVLAIKRLSRTYPQIDRRRLMGPTSQLMAQHALQGRAAAEVIDELEVLFELHYRETARSAE